VCVCVFGSNFIDGVQLPVEAEDEIVVNFLRSVRKNWRHRVPNAPMRPAQAFMARVG
jgi:hypothetical protein